ALIFAGRPREAGHVEHAHDPEPVMSIPLWILAAGALIGGVMNLPGLHWLSTFLEPTLQEPEVVFDTGRIIGQVILALVTTLLSVGGLYLGWTLYGRRFASRIRV